MPVRVRSFFLAIAAFALGGCNLPATRGHPLRSFFSSDQPLAVATFEENRLPIAPGSHGVMVGYIPVPQSAPVDDPRDAVFTYLVDFQIISSHGMGEQIEGRGMRRVFFSPAGAHASFADPMSFSRGREVETDMVRLSGEYTPEVPSLMLHVRVYESTAMPFEFEGHPVVTPENEPSIFSGRWRGNVGGWMLSCSPMSF